MAGTFYEGTRKALDDQIESLSSKAMKKGDCMSVVSPHAGYIYSGRTAACAISSLRKSHRFIVIGPNHTGLGREFSAYPEGSWETPLGCFRIDAEMTGELLRGGCEEDETAHLHEHSIEVQLPMIQHFHGHASMTAVCIMNTGYSREFLDKCERLGKAAAASMEKHDARLVASSDFSHYLPRSIAEMKDGKVAERIMELDNEGFFEALLETDASVCGFGPIAVAIAAARRLGLKPRLLDKSNSGDATGDYNSVVAYYAIGFG